MNRQYKIWQLVFAAFSVSFLIGLLVLAVRQIAPFGDNSIITIDCFHQYAPFLLEIRDRILNGKSLVYSWDAGLGRDLLVQTAYYTASPLDYLVLLIKPVQICEFVAFLILLKISLCSSAFTFYLNKHYKRQDSLSFVAGVLYGFCGFTACYYWNFMWLDVVALFPVLALGAESLVREKKTILYTVILALIMILNFYLAILVCTFITFYFLKLMLEEKHTRNEWRERILLFTVMSVLAALMTSFLLLPSAISIKHTASEGQPFPSFAIYLSIFQFIASHFAGARPSVLSRNVDAPNIYSGVITLLLLPLYIKYAPAARRKKISNGLFLLVLIICMFFQQIDYIVHGFYFTANLPHRYVFIYSFMLLVLAYETLPELRKAAKKDLIREVIIYSILLLVTDRIIVPLIPDFEPVLSPYEYVGNIALMSGYAFALTRFMAGKYSAPVRKIVIPVSLLIFAECAYMFSNCVEITTKKSEYIANMKDTREAMTYLESETEDLFYRSEYARQQAINEGSVYHYNGFSTFSSMLPGGTTNLMKSLGVISSAKSFRYYDPTALIDAMFNMKYVFSRDNQGIGYSMKSLKNFNTIDVWENQRCLPLGYMVNKKIIDWKVTASQPFAVQNDFIHKAAGVKEEMFSTCPATTVNLDNGKFLATEGTGSFAYKLNDPYALEKVPVVTAVYDCPENGYLYLYVNSDNTDFVTYYTSTEQQNRDLSAGNETIDVGEVQKGEKITVQFALNKKGEFETHYREKGSVAIYAAMYHDEAFQKAYDILSGQPWKLTSFHSTRLEGTVDAKEDGILFTSIPWNSGWKVIVDGKETEKTAIGKNGLIGFFVPKGNHTVVMDYHTPGLMTGIAMSIIGVVLFCAIQLYINKQESDAARGVTLRK